MITGKENVEVAWDWGVRRSRNIEIFSFLHLFFGEGGVGGWGFGVVKHSEAGGFFFFFFRFPFRPTKEKQKQTHTEQQVHPAAVAAVVAARGNSTHTQIEKKTRNKESDCILVAFCLGRESGPKKVEGLASAQVSSSSRLQGVVFCFISFLFFFVSFMMKCACVCARAHKDVQTATHRPAVSVRKRRRKKKRNGPRFVRDLFYTHTHTHTHTQLLHIEEDKETTR